MLQPLQKEILSLLDGAPELAQEDLPHNVHASAQRRLRRDHYYRLNALLGEMGDSALGQPFARFERLADGLGFTCLRSQGYHLGGPGQQNLWVHNRYPVLLLADSYQGGLNQARMYCCWRAEKDISIPGVEAGQTDKWHGELIVTNGLAALWAALETGGKFHSWPPELKPWPLHAADRLPSDQKALSEMCDQRRKGWPGKAADLMSA